MNTTNNSAKHGSVMMGAVVAGAAAGAAAALFLGKKENREKLAQAATVLKDKVQELGGNPAVVAETVKQVAKTTQAAKNKVKKELSDDSKK